MYSELEILFFSIIFVGITIPKQQPELIFLVAILLSLYALAAFYDHTVHKSVHDHGGGCCAVDWDHLTR